MSEEEPPNVKEIEDEGKVPQADNYGYGFDTSEFRKVALEQISSPDELDILFSTVKPVNYLAYIVLPILVLSVLLWLFFGTVPLTIEGLGIVTSKEGLNTVETKSDGVVNEILVSPGQKVEKEETVALIKQTEVKTPYAGTILEVLVRPGNKVSLGAPIVRLEPLFPLEKVVYAFIHVESGKHVTVGMEVEVELATVQVSEYGALQGKITHVSPYPVSYEHISNLLQNEGLIHYLTQGKQTVVLLTIALEKDPNTPSGYKWTSGQGPNMQISTGTVARIKGIVGHLSPLFYYFPLSRFEKLKSDLRAWWNHEETS